MDTAVAGYPGHDDLGVEERDKKWSFCFMGRVSLSLSTCTAVFIM